MLRIAGVRGRVYICTVSDDLTATGVPYPPDFLSTLPTRELHARMRAAESHPLPSLLNRGAVTVDDVGRRIWRDTFWKGSFAKDTLLGWEERLLTPVRSEGAQYTGGRFWKRFDEIRDDVAYGYVVNYGLAFLPGLPVVREVAYPDDARPYVRQGDRVLLLTYRNAPYRIVYDLIKVVDDRSCVGVMHLGTYPRGRVFGAFVMSRSNHPFEKMAVPEHDALFASAQARAPRPADLTGAWRGHLVFSSQPDVNLHHQFNPPLARLDVRPAGDGLTARVRAGLVPVRGRVEIGSDEAVLVAGGVRHHLRCVGTGTLLGRRTTTASDQPTRRYVLTRVSG